MDINSHVEMMTGNKMPIMGLGTWGLTHNTSAAITHAINIGYRMIDTSGDYGTQPAISRGIKQSSAARQDIFIVTKVEETGNAYETTLKNLNELQTDYIDLTLIHRPPQEGVGEELWRELIQAKNNGLTRDIGVSNYKEEQIETLMDLFSEKPVVNQIEWTPFGHSPDMLSFCRDNNIIIQAYSPLTHANRLDDIRLEDLAEQYDKTPAQLFIRWNLQLGTVPIVKANNFAHQEENIDIFDFEISDEDMETMSTLNEEYSALGSLAYV